jgi:hypothetical protein
MSSVCILEGVYIICVRVSHILVFETDALLTNFTVKYSCILFMYHEGVKLFQYFFLTDLNKLLQHLFQLET